MVPAKILIIQSSSIGDVVLASPVVRCLKRQLPKAELHFCTHQTYQPLVEYNPYIDKRHYFTGSPLRLIRQLSAERFDCVIDLQNTFSTNLMKTALGARSYSVETHTFRKWLYIRWKVNVLPSQHVVDRYMATVQALGVENDEQGLDCFIPYKDQVETDWLPATHQHDYVAFAIGGRQLTKRLPVERMIELCQKINYPIVLLGDKSDRATGEAIVRAVGSRLIFNACGHFNLNQSASLLQRARVVFGHDTGLVQIAAAFRKKVYSIWGSTTPQMGYYPYKTPYVRLEKTGMACRPCSHTGSKSCPLKHFRCMNDLSFDFDIKELRAKKKSFE